jgi:aminomethyltransferase
MSLRTPLYPEHQALGARLVPFAGWDMPLHYGSQLQEHHAVRRDAGMFDVSHMAVLDLEGPQARDYLRRLLANDVARLAAPGKALYSCMLREDAGVLDDLIVYYLRDGRYRLVVNAGTTAKDLDWMRARAEGFDLSLHHRDDLAMMAVQGPHARVKALSVLPEGLREAAAALKPFVAAHDGQYFVGRTGYTGEDGFELMLPAETAPATWRALVAAGVTPCGLGARDTLRLEAGMNLYGSDMDETVTPLESGLGWTLAWDPPERDFIGRAALEAQREAGGLRRFVGLVLEDKGVLRNHQRLFDGGREVGEITSGGFAPTLERSIALARVAADVGERSEVDVRGRRLAVRLVRPPFVRNGKALVDLGD